MYIAHTSINDVCALYHSVLSAEKVTVGEEIVFPNGVALYSKNTNGDLRNLLNYSSSNNTVLGYGGYINEEGETNIYGNRLNFIVCGVGTWKPYYTKGDSITFGGHFCGGFITNGGTAVCFNVPCSKPILGNPSVSVAGTLIVRQNGNYLYGSSSSAGATPSSISTWISNNDCVEIYANMPNTTNVINNHACGIEATITITFS